LIVKKLKKKLQLENFLIYFGSTIAIYLSLGLHKGSHKLQEKPSALKREPPALQNMNILYFFLYLWVIFAFLDLGQDPATQLNADPDPQPCFKHGEKKTGTAQIRI
jgi:hypothetical protein